jgi:hypothetical protein
MSLTITDDRITSDEISAYAEFRPNVAASGRGAWVVFFGDAQPAWPYQGRLFDRNQAITAMTLEERLAAGYGEDDPHVRGWRAELGLS